MMKNLFLNLKKIKMIYNENGHALYANKVKQKENKYSFWYKSVLKHLKSNNQHKLKLDWISLHKGTKLFFFYMTRTISISV